MSKKEAKEAEAVAKEKPEGEAGEAGAEGGGKKSKKKLIIIIVLAVLLLAGGGAGLYFSGVLGKKAPPPAEEGAVGEDGKPVTKTVYYTLPEFLINLNTTGKQPSFLKTTVVLELAKQPDAALVEANLPRVVDAFNTYLRELRASDLSGSAGLQRLREELLLRANKALAPTKVNDVLFKEVIVQ